MQWRKLQPLELACLDFFDLDVGGDFEEERVAQIHVAFRVLERDAQEVSRFLKHLHAAGKIGFAVHPEVRLGDVFFNAAFARRHLKVKSIGQGISFLDDHLEKLDEVIARLAHAEVPHKTLEDPAVGKFCFLRDFDVWVVDEKAAVG